MLQELLCYDDCAVGDDVVRFDRAYDNRDVAEFVKLCNSTTAVSGWVGGCLHSRMPYS